ncbi:hypothetical protein RMCBS344292_14684 [Rhizopus microsporus]|nr:hypothetical protein RMCBS344292_14684 [Rhizopus microsporus]
MLNKLRIAIGDDNDEAVAGYCRIFTEAGDAYVTLIALHPEAFGVLLDGIGECAAYKEFEVVEMTFKFWYELTNTLISEKYQAAIPRLAPYFDTLVDIMLKHLQYPPEENVMTAEDRDEFRDFRHHMGDTLKDCCRILTPQRCLAKPLHLVTNLLAQPNATWQQIEAPIFSLRSMGSEVPLDENDVMPAIMEMLSKLPDHPKIRYAATLVISRYSFWTKYHPQYITYQLNFISSGFQDPDVAAASALALKYLCKDCSKLQVFYVNIIRTLDYPDDNEVTEAISHVLAQLPVSEIQNALQIFCLPVIQQLHELVTKAQSGVSVTDDVKSYVKIGDTAVLISIFFKVIQPEVPLGQPHPCINFINELWPVFDLTLTQFGGVNTICEPLCKCFVEMIRSYRQHLLPLVPQIMERMVKAFEATGHGVYVWVAQKLVVNFIQQQEMTGLCWELVKKMSEILFIKLQTVPLDSISAAIGDYFKLITCILKDRPELLLQDPVLLSTVFRAGLAGLPMKDNVSLLDTIAFYRELVDNHLLVDIVLGLFKEFGGNLMSLLMNGMLSYFSSHLLVDIVLGLFKEFGGNLMSLLMNGMLSYFSSEVTDDSMRLVISLSKSLPNESIQWMASVMDQVPMDYTSVEKKSEFMNKWAAAIHEQQFSKLKSSLSRFIALNERDA